jgi:hypothetical protein
MTVPTSAVAAIVPAVVPMTIAVIPAGIPMAVIVPLRVVVIAARGGVIPPMTPVAVPVVPIAVVPVPAVPSPVIPTAPDKGEAVTHITVVAAADIHEDPYPVVMRHRCGTEPEQEQSNQSGAQHVEALDTSTIH